MIKGLFYVVCVKWIKRGLCAAEQQKNLPKQHVKSISKSSINILVRSVVKENVLEEVMFFRRPTATCLLKCANQHVYIHPLNTLLGTWILGPIFAVKTQAQSFHTVLLK